MLDEDRSVQITRLLQQWRYGDAVAEGQLFEIVMPNLRRIARSRLKGRDDQLQATELVNDVYEKLVHVRDRNWQDRNHFFRLVSKMMLWHLIGRARGAQPEFDSIVPDRHAAPGARLDELVLLDQLLDELEQFDARWCRVIQAKFFLGLTDPEGAAEMRVPLRTYQKMCCDANEWLRKRNDKGKFGIEGA